MASSRSQKAGKFPSGAGGRMSPASLALLAEEQPRAVIGRRLRLMPAGDRRHLDLSPRQQKALAAEDHNPQLATACKLAQADHVIRAKIILDCLPEDVRLRAAHLRWDCWDDQVEFHKLVIQSLAGPLT